MTPSEFSELRDLITGLVGEVRRIHDRLERVEARMEGLETRMEVLEERMDGLGVRMEVLEGRMDGLETRQSSLGTSFESMRGDFRAFHEALQVTNRRIDALQDEMNRRFEEQRDFTAAGFREWGERVQRIEERLAA